MIVSYHPIITADRNLLCAGRLPDEQDLAAIRSADAVILPQGCYEALYRMARNNCRLVFPNLDVRFDYPGKGGQIRLFRRHGIAHPATRLFGSLADFRTRAPVFDFPVVLKLDWGGQGETVHFAAGPSELETVLQKVAACERTGQCGFMVQQYIPCANRSLRVVVIGTRLISYWRTQPDAQRFGTAVAAGARIDYDSEPQRQSAAKTVARAFCAQTGLQLAGFDFIFEQCRQGRPSGDPLMLEINYFFGRTGLGGSDAYYRIVEQEVDKWLRLHFGS